MVRHPAFHASNAPVIPMAVLTYFANSPADLVQIFDRPFRKVLVDPASPNAIGSAVVKGGQRARRDGNEEAACQQYQHPETQFKSEQIGQVYREPEWEWIDELDRWLVLSLFLNSL